MKTQLIEPKQTYHLRNRILWQHAENEQECHLPIDQLPSTFHVGVIIDDEVASIGTFIKEKNKKFPSNNQYRLRAMATDEKYRRKGLGAKLIEFAIGQLKQKNTQLLWCDARLVAIDFYTAMGFKITGKTYHIKNVGPHKLMYLEIN